MKLACYKKGDTLWCHENVAGGTVLMRYEVVMADEEYFAVAPKFEMVNKNDEVHYTTDLTSIELYSQGDGYELRFELEV